MPRLRLLWTLWTLVAATAAAAPWPAVDSDLPPDPAVHWGVLPNGVRYAIMPNAEPKNRVSLRLLVSAGSLQERDEERGLAHFIEHMAFRGTRTHPAGSIVATLERLGMGLGPDNTAFTGTNFTIYQLELPSTTGDMLRDGLGVFREYAEHITFDRESIDAERGVIISEKETRDTPEQRIGQANRAFLWPTAREVRRSPIGLEENIRRFTRDQFVAFYDAWYRPERLAVIIVGDVDPDRAAALVGSAFNSLKARAPAREDPPDLATTEAAPPNIALCRDPGWTGVRFGIEHPVPDPRRPDTHDRRVAYLQRAVAFAMFQQRLEKIAHQAGGSYVAPAATTGNAVTDWQLAEVSVSGNVDNWKTLAADLEREHRRAIEYGFNGRELGEMRARFIAAYDEAVRTANTRSSPALATQIANALLTGNVFSTPKDVQRDVGPALARLTAPEASAAFREAWGFKALHVFLAINTAFNIAVQDVARVLNDSRAVAVAPPEEKLAGVFAYTDFGPPGELQHDELVSDLDLRMSEFQNGVRLNFKPTTFEADIVDICVRVGTGKLSQPDLGGLDFFANAALIGGGLRQHSASEISELLAGRSVSVAFNVADDACIFSGRCARRDLTLCLQLVAAYLTEAGYRAGTMRDVQASLTSIYHALENSPAGPISARAERIMTGDDHRFGVPEPAELFARNFDELAAWLEPQFKRGAIEMSVVGDVTWDEAREAAARTLGALPARTPPPPSKRAVVQFFSLPDAKNFTSSPTQTQATFALFTLATDISDTHKERRCAMLAAVLAERLRVRLREELGATYTPSAEFVQHPGFPEFGYFLLSANVTPGHLRQTARIVGQEILALQTKGISKDTFEQARQPLLRAREDDLRSNRYWLYTVMSDVQQHPFRITNVRDRSADNAAISRAEMDEMLRRYFNVANTFVFAAKPGPLVPAQIPAVPAPNADRQPQVVQTVKPDYPTALRLKKITGTVTVAFVVESDGRVAQVTALRSPAAEFSRAAEAAVLQWKFLPGMKNGVRVATRMQVDLNFNFDEQK